MPPTQQHVALCNRELSNESSHGLRAVSNEHGRAKKAVIQLVESEDECSLTITDDGVGLPKTSARDQGTGLRIMKYRAATIGASLEVCRAGEQGTRVSCSFHKQPRPKDR